MKEEDNVDYAKLLLLDEDLGEKIKETNHKVKAAISNLDKYATNIYRLFDNWQDITDPPDDDEEQKKYESPRFTCYIENRDFYVYSRIRKSKGKILKAGTHSNNKNIWLTHSGVDLSKAHLLIDFFEELRLDTNRKIKEKDVKLKRLEEINNKFRNFFGEPPSEDE